MKKVVRFIPIAIKLIENVFVEAKVENKYKCLDALRGLFALIVVIAHCHLYIGVSGNFFYLLHELSFQFAVIGLYSKHK
jgi:hypothetical protein